MSAHPAADVGLHPDADARAVRLQAVALDGLAGVGKSTVARAVAKARGWTYLDTGATYRAVTFAALAAGVIKAGDGEVDSPGPVLTCTVEALRTLEVSQDPAQPGVWLAGVDRSREIRAEDVTATVSAVAAQPRVRALLAAWQRAHVLASDGCVAEGRDVGTVVLPDASLKVWLEADVVERAGRRAADSDAPTAELSAVRAAVARRDALDTGRAVDPACPAPDAVVLDTTGLGVDAVVSAVLELMDARGLGARP